MIIGGSYRMFSGLARGAAVVAVCVEVAMSGAGAVEFERRWSGSFGGDTSFYAPQAVAMGNFSREPGQEIISIDTDGYAYFLAWKDNSLKNIWITSGRAISGHIASLAGADVDGDGEDEAAIVDRDGALHMLGGERKKFKMGCGDCVPGDFKGFKASFVAAAQTDSDRQEELLLVGKLKGKLTGIVIEQRGKGFAALTSFPLDVNGEVVGLMPARTPSRGAFYLNVYRGRAGDEIQPFHLDEEGAQLAAPIDMKASNVSIVWVFSGDTDGDHNNELFLIGTSGKGIKAQRVVVALTPGSKTFKPMPMAKADASFLIAPDLNGDGIAELVCADYTGSAEVYSRAALTLVVNGKSRSAGADVRLRGGLPYVSTRLLSGFTVEKKPNYVVIRGSKRSLGLDLKQMKSTLRLPGEEESVDGKVAFFAEGGNVFMKAGPLSEALGFQADWDGLSQTLKLNFKSR